MGVIAIIQARMGSARFPGKSIAEIDGKPILEIMIDQLSHCQMLEKTILAIPDTRDDDRIAELALQRNWNLFRGSEQDVLDRFYQAALLENAGPEMGIVRLTGDDILPDPYLVDAVAQIHLAFDGQFDYITTDRKGRLPYGAAIELMSFRALNRAHKEATKEQDREHVVPYIKWNPDKFRSLEFTSSFDLSNVISLSIDYPPDLVRATKLFRFMQSQKSPPFHLSDILEAAPLVLEEQGPGENA